MGFAVNDIRAVVKDAAQPTVQADPCNNMIPRITDNLIDLTVTGILRKKGHSTSTETKGTFYPESMHVRCQDMFR